jgi:acetylornithine deacetylase
LPYELKMNDSEIWGRGSSDAKASVATQVIALMDLLHSHKDRVSEGSVSLLFVVGEELDGSGMRFFSDHKPTNYSSVIFGEPTERKLASGHKGIIQFLIKVKGRPAHSGYPWLGLSANEVLVQALAKLLELEAKLPGSEMLGKSTLNIGRIEGGVAANVVAQDALARVAIRLAGGTPEEIEDMIFDALRELREKTEYNGGLLDIEIIGRPYGPIMLDADVDGFKKISVNYGTDIPNLDGDHKKYLYGPGSILVAHSDHENIRVADLEGAVKDYQRLILATLGRA